MSLRPVFSLRESAAFFLIISILASLLVGKEEIAYNSGARERLAYTLRSIWEELDSFEKTTEVSSSIDLSNWDDELFRVKFCTFVKWYDGNAYHDVYFVPVVFASDFTVGEKSNHQFPIVVMIPRGSAELQEAPTAWDSETELPENECVKCRMASIGRLFLENGIEDATVLMSDGSIHHAPISKLFRNME